MLRTTSPCNTGADSGCPSMVARSRVDAEMVQQWPFAALTAIARSAYGSQVSQYVTATCRERFHMVLTRPLATTDPAAITPVGNLGGPRLRREGDGLNIALACTSSSVRAESYGPCPIGVLVPKCPLLLQYTLTVSRVAFPVPLTTTVAILRAVFGLVLAYLLAVGLAVLLLLFGDLLAVGRVIILALLVVPIAVSGVILLQVPVQPLGIGLSIFAVVLAPVFTTFIGRHCHDQYLPMVSSSSSASAAAMSRRIVSARVMPNLVAQESTAASSRSSIRVLMGAPIFGRPAGAMQITIPDIWQLSTSQIRVGGART